MPIYVVPKDSRQRYTKMCLVDAFLKALEEKPVSAITVSELSIESGISRKTFYKYYSDPFALLTALQDDLVIGFKQELESLPSNIFAITPALIEFCEKHRVLIRAVFENQSAGGFIDQVIRHLYSTYRVEWEQANPEMSKQDVEFLFQYVVSGLTGIIRHWLINDPSLPVNEVVKQADFLMRLTTPG